jgi:hypothetical protein
MRIREIALVTAFAALALGAPQIASAEDVEVKGGTVITFGDGVARFDVVRDPATGTATFRLADPTVKITDNPVIVLQTEQGPKEVALVAVQGQPGSWRVVHESFRTDRFDAVMRITVNGKVYTAPWAAQPRWVARHGGMIVAFDDCAAQVEIVHDLKTGTLKVFSSEDVKIAGVPQITITESKTPTTVALTPIEGQPGAWMVTHQSFKTTTVSGTIRITVNDQPCEAPLTFVGTRGGRIVTVQNGPRFEVIRDPKGSTYTFYALDEQIDGKPVVIENPQFVMTTPEGPRTVSLVRVENEPRAWRLVGLDAKVTEPLDGHLRFTLFGRSLETHLGLSGIGIGVR